MINIYQTNHLKKDAKATTKLKTKVRAIAVAHFFIVNFKDDLHLH